MDAPLEAPKKGAEDYGTVVREDPEIMMPAAIGCLVGEYQTSSYVAYPFMFYKEVKLNEALYPEKSLHLLGAAGQAAVWLVPGIMVVTALGALITELISPLFAVFVQGIWWYLALQTNRLTGTITKYTLIIRHNSLGEPELFSAQYGDFLWNRISYFAVSLILVGITVIIYEKKRRGLRDGKGNIRKHLKGKSKA